MKLIIEKKELVMPIVQTYFKSCHSSTSVRADNGNVLVAYFGGTAEGTDDTKIYVSEKENGKWQPPRVVKGNGDMPHWNPVLFKDGKRIYLFYKRGKTCQTWISYYCWSDDDGKTFSDGIPLVENDTTPRGPVRNKVIVLANGRWLAPSSIENEKFWDSYIDISDDEGKTWEKALIPITHRNGSEIEREHLWQGLIKKNLWESDLDVIRKWDGIIQPTLWTSDDNNVHALMRSTRGRVYRSDSADGGFTWCEAYETEIPNNNSGIDVAKTSDGTLALCHNPIGYNWGERSPISLAFSFDDGQTFTSPFALETIDNGELSYPSINAEGELLRITFTVNRKSFCYIECRLEK